MEDTSKRMAAVLITVSVLTAVYLYIGNNDNNRYAIDQLTTENFFPNNTENIKHLTNF